MSDVHDDGFGPDHLPFGVYSQRGGDGRRHVGVRLHDHVLAVGPAAVSARQPWGTLLVERSLDPLLAAGRETWEAVRAWLQDAVGDGGARVEDTFDRLPLDAVDLHLAWTVADYVDFYASEHHATNLGRIFRPDGEPLTPNWKHLPIGYHGRSGTVVVSGTDVVRPRGQRRPPGTDAPTFGPSARLDLEAEVGFVVGTGSALGEPVPVQAFADHVFGVVLVNDWSARDLQAWEYVPLGPFLGKSFATSVAAWVTPLAALAAARVPLPGQAPRPLPYLRHTARERPGLDLALEVELDGEVVSRPPFAQMYWSPAQMLAHLTVNGASLRTGDLFASGTVSGPAEGERGSLIELGWNGQRPVQLADGRTRAWLEDGDTLTLRASAPSAAGGRLRLGEVSGTVRPARRRGRG